MTSQHDTVTPMASCFENCVRVLPTCRYCYKLHLLLLPLFLLLVLVLLFFLLLLLTTTAATTAATAAVTYYCDDDDCCCCCYLVGWYYDGSYHQDLYLLEGGLPKRAGCKVQLLEFRLSPEP